MTTFCSVFAKTEPTCKHNNTPVKVLIDFYESLKDIMIQGGLCQFARDKKTGEVVCWRLGIDDYDFVQKESSLVIPPELVTTFDAMDKVETHDIHPTAQCQWAKYLGLCTAKAHSKKGLGTMITQHNLNLIKEKGYFGTLVCASSNYSYRAFLRCGFKSVSYLKFTDYVYDKDGSKPFFDIPAPHEGIHYMVQKF